MLASRVSTFQHVLNIARVERLVAPLRDEQLLRLQLRPLLHPRRLPLHALLASVTEQADRVCSELALARLVAAALEDQISVNRRVEAMGRKMTYHLAFIVLLDRFCVSLHSGCNLLAIRDRHLARTR